MAQEVLVIMGSVHPSLSISPQPGGALTRGGLHLQHLQVYLPHWRWSAPVSWDAAPLCIQAPEKHTDGSTVSTEMVNLHCRLD